MRRSALTFLLAIFFLALFSLSADRVADFPAAAKENWTRVKSRHFLLVGNANEGDILKVAIKLEQFRDAFSRLFPSTKLSSTVPITVIVFKNRHSYIPFMPTYQGRVSEVAGYFLSTQDANYITLTAESNQKDQYRIIFHEYVHAMTNKTLSRSPTWFGEGLAEFYSTFEVAGGDKKITLGMPISHHVYLLRDNKFLPLPKLFAVDHDSPEYNERDKKGVFYAQSWALVHYLILGNDGRRQSQLIKYVDLVLRDKPADESFREAFQTDYVTMERELQNYINRNTYPTRVISYQEKLEFDASMQSAQISEAEWNYYLGDLLLHLDRADCEQYLQKAIQLDPNLAVAYASLGMAQMKMQNFAKAKEHLQRALSIGSQNHMVHYYHAFILSREGVDANNIVRSYSPEVARTIREHLRKAILIAPEFPESYHLLAFMNMVTNQDLDESIDMLKRAMALSPGRQDYSFMIAQIYMQQQKYDEALTIAEQLSRTATEPDIRKRAQSMIDNIQTIFETIERHKAEDRIARSNRPPSDGKANSTSSSSSTVPRREFEGDKLRGMLTEISCSDKGIMISVKDGARSFKLHSSTLDQVFFLTYTRSVPNSITCGKVVPAKPVLVTYRRSTAANSRYDGELVAVEFIKDEE